jgi:epoxide hydrolase-like predicted phosphatase
MEIKAILSDVGGVLVRTRDTSGRHAWEKRLGLSQGQLRQEVFSKDHGNLATLGFIKEDDIWNDLQKKYSLTDNEIHQLYKDFFSGDQLNIPLFDFLMGIRDRYDIALISNAWSNARKIYTEEYHLNRLTKKIIISAEEGLRKPDERIYKKALDLLGVSPEEVIFIDDTLENVTEAKKLGIHSLHLIHTAPTIEKLQQLFS